MNRKLYTIERWFDGDTACEAEALSMPSNKARGVYCLSHIEKKFLNKRRRHYYAFDRAPVSVSTWGKPGTLRSMFYALPYKRSAARLTWSVSQNSTSITS